MAKKFGKTWWGSYWLKSLDNIDYENRIPRGATYARAGRVRDVKIKENIITAKVQGSRVRPYTVMLVIPPFSAEDVENLMGQIIQRPALISKLLNRELDAEMLTIAEKLGLKVFPRQWTDFKMQCSCPDWAVPCKHLAAVIYMVSQEIDNNPFLVFEMHKVNLLQELNARGIHVDAHNESAVLPIKKLILNNKNQSDIISSDEAYQRIDFSLMRDITLPLIHLLADNPPFYNEGNFRDKYEQELLRVTKNVNRFFKNDLEVEGLFPDKVQPDRITYHTAIRLTLDHNDGWSIESNQFPYNATQLISALLALNTDYMEDYQPSVAALHNILFFALHLLKTGAIIPQIVQLENKHFTIRWLPAHIDEKVNSLLHKMEAIVPVDILLIGKTRQPVQNQVEWITSFFLKRLIDVFSSDTIPDSIIRFFFKNISRDFNKVGEKEMSGSIKVWLDRYFITANQYSPVIIIKELSNDKFGVDVSVEDHNHTQSLSTPIPLQGILINDKYKEQRYQILREISLLSPFIKGLDECINNNGTSSITMALEEFTSFLTDILPMIRLLNVKVLLPKALREIVHPKLSVKIKAKEQDEGGFLRLDDMLAFDWQVAMGNQLISVDEFKKLTLNAAGLLKFKGHYFFVSEEEILQLQKRLNKNATLSAAALLQTALADEFEGNAILLTEEVRKLIKQITAHSTIPLPTGLQATLRPYQIRGYEWMYRNMKIGFGSIIADDMGLGKTLQVIALLLKLKEENQIDKKHKIIVVMPTGLLINWQTEIERFAPSLSVHLYHGSARELDDFTEDVLLTSYGVLRSDHEQLGKLKWRAAVIDEAQNIKNQNTAQSKSVRALKADVHIAMSGTPVENRLSEFWSIMDFTNKGYLGSVKDFKTDYALPIQLYNDEDCIRRFRSVTAPFMMRRLKTDKTIISDLPEKIEQNEYAVLTKQQVAIYQQTVQTAMSAIESETGTDSQSLFKRKGLILQMILALKQICNHPAQYLKDGHLDASLSGKTELLLDMVDSIVEQNEKVLIFTQFKEMGGYLQQFMEERFGEKPMFYHGGCSIPERQAMIERFQHNRADKVFILSLKAAGTGLNLTAAAHVIHYDLWWNPAVEAQATDRAYRIGQTKNVHVHRFITKNTFEEKIDAMIQHKKELANMTVATGENWIGQLSNKELHEIFGGR